MISRAVVRVCMSALASFSNCRVTNQPCAAASSIGFVDHAHAAFGRRGDHHLGAQKPHEPAALDAERFGHDDDQRIALLGADHGEADAGVAAGRLDDGLAGLQRAAAFGRLDHAQGQAVLH